MHSILEQKTLALIGNNLSFTLTVGAYLRVTLKMQKHENPVSQQQSEMAEASRQHPLGETQKPSSVSQSALERSSLLPAVTDEGEWLTITKTVIRTHADFAVGSTVDSIGDGEADKELQQNIYNVPLVLLILLFTIRLHHKKHEISKNKIKTPSKCDTPELLSSMF